MLARVFVRLSNVKVRSLILNKVKHSAFAAIIHLFSIHEESDLSMLESQIPVPASKTQDLEQTSAPAHTNPNSPHRNPSSKGVRRDEAVASEVLAWA